MPAVRLPRRRVLTACVVLALLSVWLLASTDVALLMSEGAPIHTAAYHAASRAWSPPSQSLPPPQLIPPARNPSFREMPPPPKSVFHVPLGPAVVPSRAARTLKADDRLSHINMKLASDYYFGFLKIPPYYGFEERLELIRLYKNSSNERFERMRDGAVIYVDSYFLRNFTTDILPRINVRFVLITGDSSVCVPNCIVNKGSTLKLATDPRMLHWYTSHCSGYTRFAQRIECMPLGIDQHRTARIDMQRVYTEGIGLIDGLVPKKLDWKLVPERYLLISFQISTNNKTRQYPWDLFCGDNEVDPQLEEVRQVSTCFFQKGMDKYEFYKNYLSRHPFVLSPEGYGLDCYRTYETLLLGGYPIVLTSDLDIIFQHLPVLILQDWTDLTIDLMEETYKSFQMQKWDFSPLYVSYWAQRARSHLSSIN
ncbi:hypothetical protein BC830DRAFT_394654 [Chytriomyces sp. MP71]|nr:hypothetical protein BC830DRAFT_394654 [Chytriomyces sp. MP71]